MRSHAPARPRRWQATLITTLVFTAAVGAAAMGWWYARESPPHQGPIVLISVDGLSSGELTAYGARATAAPAIDALAADSVLFERAYVHSPQMLPAYASLLTGRLPFDHGVRDDAGFTLPPEARTLAELLRSRGFDTGAVVSSFLLRRETGLAQGFSFFETSPDAFEAAARWLRSRDSQRFLLFLEIPASGADRVVRDLLALLKERKRYDTATILLVGGRGSGAERGALDDASLRVPFFVRQPNGQGAGRRVSVPVQHVDLLPTMLDLVRAPIPGGLRGRSLRPVLDDSDETVPVRPIYSESLEARFRFGGRAGYALTGDGHRLVRDGGEMLVTIGAADLPNPTPGASDPAPLRAELDRLQEAPPPAARAALSVAEEDQLAQLGILAEPPGVPDPPPGAVPEDQAPLLEAHRRAARLIGEKQYAQAIRALQDIVRTNPLLPAVHYQLGSLLERAGRFDEAVAAFREAERTWPDSLPVALALTHTLARAGRLDQAQEQADTAIARAEGGTPADRAAALEAAVRVALDKGDFDVAERHAEALFALDGSRAYKQLVLGRRLLGEGKYEEAREALDFDGVRGEDAPAGLRVALAEALVHLDRPADAESELRLEIEEFPRDPQAYVSLAMLLRSLGRDEDVERVLSDLVAGSPTPEGSAIAARTWTALGDRRRADAIRADARARFRGDPSLALLGRGRP